MESKRLIVAVLGLVIGLAAGFYLGRGSADTPFPMPPDREKTLVSFQQEGRWYVSRASDTDPFYPCVPPINFDMKCTPQPDPDGCKNNPNPNCWTVYTPELSKTAPIGVPVID